MIKEGINKQKMTFREGSHEKASSNHLDLREKQIQDIGLEILLKAGLDTLSIFQRVWVCFFIAICRNSLLLKYVSILTG